MTDIKQEVINEFERLLIEAEHYKALFKKENADNVNLRAEVDRLKKELKKLQFETSEQHRFIWWVHQVYARNVKDLIRAIENSKIIIPANWLWSVVRNLNDYTEKIYNGTYLCNEISVDVKLEEDKMEGNKNIDELMMPVLNAIKKHVKDKDAVTEIYNRTYEALMIKMDEFTPREIEFAKLVKWFLYDIRTGNNAKAQALMLEVENDIEERLK